MTVKAAIDIGTNSVRLLVVNVKDDGLPYPLLKCLETTRLGAGVDAEGILSDSAMDRTLKAVNALKGKARSMGAEDIAVIATSAVRDAGNGPDFVNKIKSQGLNIDVLDGREEAKLGFYGAVLGCGKPGKEIVVIDIGGGSTELSFGENSHIRLATSMDIGAVRMTERFLQNDIIIEKEVAAVRIYVRNELAHLRYNPADSSLYMIGIGGTITSLAAIDQKLAEYRSHLVHRYIIDKHSIEKMIKELSRMPLEERKKVPGLHPGRADIIVAGAIILDEIMDFLQAKSIMTSEWDNLEGVIFHKFIQNDEITG